MNCNIDFEFFVDYISQKHTLEIKYDLNRIEHILKEMGAPEKTLHGIHVAGTNGKGSTSAICEAFSIAHGYSTGLYTSPHLLDYRERFRINQKKIASKELMDYYQKFEPVFEESNASFFEITTALAFYSFAQHQLHTNIIEVGLGGRLDATNTFSPQVSIITSIGLDHMQILGDTIEKIAYEKGCIIKEKRPVVVGDVEEKALKMIKSIANEKEASLLTLNDHFFIENVKISEHGTEFDLINNSPQIPLPCKLDNLRTNLIGIHQAKNAALAIVAYSFYMKEIDIEYSESKIRYALEHISWPGRLQIISQAPLTILDCAHNEQGINTLVENLKILYPHRKINFIISILRDKNFPSMIEKVCKIAKHIYITRNHSERAAEIDDQLREVKLHNVPYTITSDIKTALTLAQNYAQPDGVIVVTGSIYTISELITEDLFV
jgi:dihydrofolate synthase/folylpolyglutamate synthase